jgi:lysozyme
MSTLQRLATGSLSLLAATLVSIAGYESYTSNAVIPVPGDVPTMGHGTTRHADGTPVRMGERTNPTRALVDLLRDAGGAEQAVKRCAPVPMHPWEFSAFVSLTYNIGEGAFCQSTLRRKLLAHDYAGACAEILRWDKFQGQPLRGLTLRRQAEYKTCIDQEASQP